MSQTWPQDWEERKSGRQCSICSHGRPEQTNHGVRFFAGDHADAYLQRLTPMPGYATVIFRDRHVADPIHFTADETIAFWSDVCIAARAIEEVFSPCHLNYQLLGNAVPHVHVHLVPRYLDDPSPERPLGDAMWESARKLTPEALAEQIEALTAAIRTATP